MSYSVIISREAERDLRDIYEYIAGELMAPENAEGQYHRLKKAILSLEEFPLRHRCHNNLKWEGRGLRMLPVDNYCVFYIAEEDLCEVQIIRVIYGARNLADIFG